MEPQQQERKHIGMAELQEAVIVSAVRTAIGTYSGGLAEVPATKLGEICIRAALERADLKAAHQPLTNHAYRCKMHIDAYSRYIVCKGAVT